MLSKGVDDKAVGRSLTLERESRARRKLGIPDFWHNSASRLEEIVLPQQLLAGVLLFTHSFVYFPLCHVN